MKHLIGGATSFSSGGPGKGMYCRAVTNLMQKYYFISSADVICSNFTDSGLFGITVSGIGSHQMDLLSVAMEELHRLREPIPPAELNRTKAVELNPTAYYMMFLKAKIEYKMGDKKAGNASAENTIALAEEAKNADYVALASKLLEANK